MPMMEENAYTTKIRSLLEQVRDAAREHGLDSSDPYDMSDAEERWALHVQPAGSSDDEDGVEVSITVLESEQCDGQENGLNFGLDVVSHGGRILGGLCPFNYTDRVWVDRDDSEAVEERWKVFANAFDAGPVVDSIEGFFSGTSEEKSA